MNGKIISLVKNSKVRQLKRNQKKSFGYKAKCFLEKKLGFHGGMDGICREAPKQFLRAESLQKRGEPSFGRPKKASSRPLFFSFI
jgi:hypothetical protein